MAGSYGHVNPETGGRWSLIENMGDAYECVEELLYLVRCFADASEIKRALEAFGEFERGEKDPAALVGGGPEFELPPSLGDYGKAYMEAKKVMEGE